MRESVGMMELSGEGALEKEHGNSRKGMTKMLCPLMEGEVTSSSVGF